MTPELFAALESGKTAEVSLDTIPYAGFLGMALYRDANKVGLRLHYDPMHIGAPGRLHGGVIGAVLEIAAIAELMWQARRDGAALAHLPKPVTLTVDYLRAAGLADVRAGATILRRGRRIASVRALAWQESEARPVAEGLLHFLLVSGGAEGRDHQPPKRGQQSPGLPSSRT